MLFKLVSLKVNASQNVQLAVTLRIEKKQKKHKKTLTFDKKYCKVV